MLLTIFLNISDIRNYLYVCLRRHANANSSGVNVVDKPVSYQAFHLTVTIKQMTDGPETHLCDHNNGLFLVIFAVPVYSAYKGKSSVSVLRWVESNTGIFFFSPRREKKIDQIWNASHGNMYI